MRPKLRQKKLLESSAAVKALPTFLHTQSLRKAHQQALSNDLMSELEPRNQIKTYQNLKTNLSAVRHHTGEHEDQ